MRETLKKLAPENMKEIYRVLRSGWISFLFALFRLFPVRKNRIVLANVWGFGDNTKYITLALAGKLEEMKGKAERSEGHDAGRKSGSLGNSVLPEIIYVTDTHVSEGIPSSVRAVKTNSVKAIFYLATAGVWVDSNRKENYICKRKGQYYIQTWHGSFALKKVEAEAAGLPAGYTGHAKRDAAMTDLMITNGEYFKGIVRRAFYYRGECRDLGSARMDILLRKSKNAVKEKLHIPENARFALYAPTFRDEGELPELDVMRAREALERKFGAPYYMVVRYHPLKAAGKKYTDPKIIDGNLHGDLYELLAEADVLISDYSSTILEFAYAGGRVFLYAPDKSLYKNARGLYFDYDSLPFPIAAGMEEFCGNIENYDEDVFAKKQRSFFEKLNVCESGHASEDIAELILSKAGC